MTTWLEEKKKDPEFSAAFDQAALLSQIAAALGEHLHQSKLTAAEVATRLDMSERGLVDMMSRSSKLTLDQIVRVAHAMGVSLRVTLVPRDVPRDST